MDSSNEDDRLLIPIPGVCHKLGVGRTTVYVDKLSTRPIP
jgi:hypothetical protein